MRLFILSVLLVSQSLLAAPKKTNYIAIVQDNEDVLACSQDVKRIRGVSSLQTLDIIGVLTFKATDAAVAKVSQLPCIMSVEVEQEAYPLN